jgi:hypothetical protein
MARLSAKLEVAVYKMRLLVDALTVHVDFRQFDFSGYATRQELV